jgi:hypothetical protein
VKRLFRGFALGGVGWALTTATLVLPQLLGLAPQVLTQLAAIVVGIQAAQSALVQVGSTQFVSRVPRRYLCWGAVILVVPTVVHEVPTLTDVVLPTCAGAFLGICMGESALHKLTNEGGVAYQRFQATRSAGFFVSAAVASLTAAVLHLSLAAVLFVALVGAMVEIGNTRSVAEHRMAVATQKGRATSAGITIVFGVLGSLYYRNDVNWLRASVQGMATFDVWHTSLVLYAAVQGAVGFVVIQVFLADRKRVRNRLAQAGAGIRAVVLLVWLAASVIIAVMADWVPIWVAVGLAALLAAIVNAISGVAHAVSRSWAPYLAGVVSTTLLLLLLHSGVDPRVVLCLQSGIIGLIILAGMVSTRKVAVCNSQPSA